MSQCLLVPVPWALCLLGFLGFPVLGLCGLFGGCGVCGWGFFGFCALLFCLLGGGVGCWDCSLEACWMASVCLLVGLCLPDGWACVCLMGGLVSA
jgi:hypothetical protein